MPIYSYRCEECGAEYEVICRYDERDNQDCGSCGKKMTRAVAEKITIGKSGYQPGVILGSGEKVKGHFGKDARKK